MPRRTARGNNSSKRRVWQLVALACVAILAYFLFSLSGLVISKGRLDDRLITLRSEVSALAAESADLEREAARLQTDEALEELAREELGWTKAGETGVVVMAPTPTPSPAPAPSTTLRVSSAPNWERWWQAFFGE